MKIMVRTRATTPPTPNVTLTSQQFQQLLATVGHVNTPTPTVHHTPTTCTYKQFMDCKPSSFKGSEGAVELVRWFEKLESVFRISNCPEADRVKYATCTLSGSALTWWNAYSQTVGIDVAIATPWETVKHLMTNKYCPRNQIQKMESELWELRVKNNDLDSYTQRFLELSSLCTAMVTPEYKKIERYVEGLPGEIQGHVLAAGKDTIDGVILLAQDLMMAFKRRTAKQGDNKRKSEGDGKDSSQHPNKKAADGTSSGSKNYVGKHPYCSRCEKHHPGKCTVECTNCKKLGHLAKNCRLPAATSANKTPIAKNNTNVPTCYGCGEKGHIRPDCPKKAETGKAKSKAYVMVAEEAPEESDAAEEAA